MRVKSLITGLVLVVFSTTTMAQKSAQTTFLDGEGQQVNSLEEAETFVIFKSSSKKKKEKTGMEATYLKDSTLVQFRELEKGNAMGQYFAYDPETGVTYRGKMKGVTKIGNWYTTDAQSNIVKVEVYDNAGNNIVTTDMAANGNTILPEA